MSAAATELWAAVKARYDEQGLISLTNVRKRNAGAINNDVGEQAADDVILAFYTDVQTDYDDTSDYHLTVAIEGVIAMLWKRGGTAATIAKVKWEDWVERAKILKGVEPRGHAEPGTNSGLQPSRDGEVTFGRQRPWSDRMNFRGLLPRVGRYGPYGGPAEWD